VNGRHWQDGRVRLRFSAALVAVVAVSGTPAAHPAPTQLPPLPRIAPSCVESDFTSAGRTVRARLCLPDGASQTRRVPGVIVLHGCGGFGTLDQTLAHRLPEHGIATYYVDYFGLTPPPSRKGFCNAHGAVGDAFATWLRITRDATAALRRIPAVDPQRAGAVGWSLGGGLALSAAEQYRHLFATLVLFSAFAFGPELQDVGRLPPTLVLSGGSGDVVPVSDAVALYRTLRRDHVPTELRVYPHGNHQWKHAQFAAGLRWTLGFLDRHL
jgi:dienelactone hydrolase